LVTGASGFIGAHLIERLRKEGYAVRALVHRNRAQVPPLSDVEVVAGDVRQAVLMKSCTASCDTVFHLAGRAHTLAKNQGDEDSHHAVNVEGTRNVLEGVASAGVRRFVFFSSVKAMEEEEQTSYGRSKLAAEQLTLDYGKRLGIHVACVRLPLVYGPGNKGNLLRMIAAIDRGLFPPLPELGNRRSMVHVRDVVQAAVLAAGMPAANGQCYIVTDGVAYSTRRLYELICRALGKRIPAWRVPVWALTALGLAGDAIGRIRGKRFIFDSDALDKLIGSAWYSSEKISHELGYRPTVTLEDALPEMIAWYRKAGA
jgi:nucleoside-diphosphate-sugar epimerase